MAPQVDQDLEELDSACAEIHRDHPFHRSPDFVAALRELMNQPAFQSVVDHRY